MELTIKGLKPLFLSLCAANTCCNINSYPAIAEGYKNSDPPSVAHPFGTGGGVDRFVYSKGGYVEDAGTATLAVHYPDNNIWEDNAGFYLGAKQTAADGTNSQVDAGIAYDSHTYKQPDGTTPVGPGYEAFISHGGFPHPRKWNRVSQTWDVWRGTADTYTLHFAVEPDTGYVSITISGFGTIYSTDQNGVPPLLPEDPQSTTAVWPDKSVALKVFDPAHLDKVQVKRVVAMNRQGNPNHVHAEPQFDDGAFLSVAVSGCQITKVAGGPLNAWGPNDVYQPDTGFDSPSNVALYAKDMLDAHGNPTPLSKYRVNFPKTNCGGATQADNEAIARNGQYPNSAAGLDPHAAAGTATISGNSRYNEEYVEIWLRHDPNVVNNVVRRRPPHH